MEIIDKLRSGTLANFGNGFNGEFFNRVADRLTVLERENAQLRRDRKEAKLRVDDLHERLIADDNALRWENTEFKDRLYQRGQELTAAEKERAELRAENANLKAAIRGKTFYHSDEAVMQELGEVRTDRDRLAGEVERLNEEPACVGCNTALADRCEKAESALASALEEVERLKLENAWPKVVFNDPEEGGRAVRHAWVEWAKTQSNPKASWLVPYDELSEVDKEADRQIAQYLAQTLLRDIRAQLTAAQQFAKEQFRAGMERAAEIIDRLIYHKMNAKELMEARTRIRAAAANEQGGEG